MSTNHRVIEATSEVIWEVLSDGWLYPLWVVGASRMRDVDESWPEVGSELHHSVGVWPALLDDSTVVEECHPLRLLRLRAKGWPAGEAMVTITLRPDGPRTEVVIEEDAASGPGTLVPKPLRDPVLAWRNVETLRRLAFICERRP